VSEADVPIQSFKRSNPTQTISSWLVVKKQARTIVVEAPILWLIQSIASMATHKTHD
jgi:hypothetical protein